MGIAFANLPENSNLMAFSASSKPIIERMAQAGYIAKGVVYALLGLTAFLSAFELAGQRGEDATQSGALQLVKDLPAGTVLLVLLAAGLFCYSAWRGLQTFSSPGGEKTKWPKRLRYLVSGLAYLALGYAALRLVFASTSSGGDQNRVLAAELLQKPAGQILVALAALIFAATGLYQIYYGWSEKYRKHVQDLTSSNATLLLRAGKIGYVSRGLVWLVISYLFARAAVLSRADEAGNTGKAFRFVENSPFGSYLLGALGLGLVAYGIFNFIRARYERFSAEV